MEQKIYKSTFFVLILCLCSIFSSSFAAPSLSTKKVLLVHSYHAEYPWVSALTAGVQKAFEGEDVCLEIVYMDAKRNTSYEWKVKAGKMVRERIETWQPDVVIVADDTAQVFVTQQYIGKKPYFVFCGVNGDPADYGFPASNITGILERPRFIDTVEYLKQIVPAVRKIALLSDNDITSVGTLNYIQEASQTIVIKILNFHLIGDFTTWQRRIQQYNMDADAIGIYTFHTIKDQENAISMSPEAVMEWTNMHCTIPTFAFLDFAIEQGVLCGVVESGEEQGYEAARMARALLEGDDIISLPIHCPQKGSLMINLKTAERLGIFISEKTRNTAEKLFL